MSKFRKKPVVIEAVRVSAALRAASNDWRGLPPWLSAAYEAGKVLFVEKHIEILTLEGRMQADYEDWIICGVKGELYPCKPDIFKATYDAVDDTPRFSPE